MIGKLIAVLGAFLSLFIRPAIIKDTSILITGDIMLGRTVTSISLAKEDPKYPFEKVAAVMRKADISFGNLEAPIVTDCPKSEVGFKFCADSGLVEGLKFAGVDVVSIANNHSGNYGAKGISETEDYLKEAGIDLVGSDNLVIKEVNGAKFGFLGFDFVDKIPQSSDYQLVRDSDSKVDVLVVMPHWGTEYTAVAGEFQQETARSLIDAGADVVAGSHPHWVQNIEYINERPVFYSLGNFIFDQPWSEETKKGLAVRLTYHGVKLQKVEQLPIYMKNVAQPEWVSIQ